MDGRKREEESISHSLSDISTILAMKTPPPNTRSIRPIENAPKDLHSSVSIQMPRDDGRLVEHSESNISAIMKTPPPNMRKLR
jgi:hypothetical protein